MNVGKARLNEELDHTASSELFAERRGRNFCETDLVDERLVVGGDDLLVRRSDVGLLQELAHGQHPYGEGLARRR